MSTKKTANLGLHSWVKSDPFKMQEFNENFDAIDKAVAGKAEKTNLDALAGQVDKKADKTVLDAETNARVALAAQVSALDAAKAAKTDLAAETAARKAALETLTSQMGALDASRLRFKFDSYQGTGSTNVRLDFDFKPLLVIVSNKDLYAYGGYPWINGVAQGYSVSPDATPGIVKLTWENRAVQWTNLLGNNADNRLNATNTTYHYFAVGIA